MDEEDFETVNAFKWTAALRKGCVYARRYLRKDEEGYPRHQYLHQFLIPGEEMVDHRDGKGHDNRRSNLRPATNQQNLQGFKRKKPGTTSKFRGVSWDRLNKKWKTQIQIDGKNTYVGIFITEEDAARAYDTAARKYFGEFASPNFP